MDVLVDLGRRVIPVEVKLTMTVRAEGFAGFDFYAGLAGARGGVLIYGGDNTYPQGRHLVRSWCACS